MRESIGSIGNEWIPIEKYILFVSENFTQVAWEDRVAFAWDINVKVSHQENTS